MVPEFFDPRIQPVSACLGIAVQCLGQLTKFRCDPADYFQKRCVLFIKICPVNDALVVEDAVAEFTQTSQAAVQRLEVSLGLGCGTKGEGGDVNDVPALCLMLVEKGGPKSKGQLRNHPPRRYGFAQALKVLFGIGNLTFLGLGEQFVAGTLVIPLRGEEMVFQSPLKCVTQSHLHHLQRRVRRLTKRHISKVACKRDVRLGLILMIGLESLRCQSGFKIFKKTVFTLAYQNN